MRERVLKRMKFQSPLPATLLANPSNQRNVAPLYSRDNVEATALTRSLVLHEFEVSYKGIIILMKYCTRVDCASHESKEQIIAKFRGNMKTADAKRNELRLQIGRAHV